MANPSANESPPFVEHVGANAWCLRTVSLTFTHRPCLMGIVNVTPDSFSDGGCFLSVSKAVEHALQLVEEGAAILDIGGESTRPYSQPVGAEEELRRVVPVIQALRQQTSVPISIDTSKAMVARAAIELGAEIINDVTGLEGDPAMAPLAAETGAGLCIMHMRGTPQTMQDNPEYGDVVREVSDYLRQRVQSLIVFGIQPDRIAVDPGIGFGKTHSHNLELLQRMKEFHQLGRPLLVGYSRKGFIARMIGDKDRARVAGGIGVALAMATQGVHILRVHDVQAVKDALDLFAACGALGKEAAKEMMKLT